MESSISSKKQTKKHRIVVKTNWFVCFLEEFMAWQFDFEINWPLDRYKQGKIQRKCGSTYQTNHHNSKRNCKKKIESLKTHTDY